MDFNPAGDKPDGKAGEASSSYIDTSYNYGHPEVSQRPKDTSTYHTKRVPTTITTARCHQPRRPCQREVRTEVEQATTPAGVETADGPQHLTSRHAEAGQAQTCRYSHHEASYRPKAAAPWCLQGNTHCTEREPNCNATVICFSLTRAPPVAACKPQKQAEPPPPPSRATPPKEGGSRRNGPPPCRRAPYPPNTQQIHPTQSRKIRDHTDDGDIEKNPGPDDQ